MYKLIVNEGVGVTKKVHVFESETWAGLLNKLIASKPKKISFVSLEARDDGSLNPLDTLEDNGWDRAQLYDLDNFGVDLKGLVKHLGYETAWVDIPLCDLVEDYVRDNV